MTTKVKQIMKARLNAGFSQAVQDRLKELGLTIRQLACAVYGTDHKGTPNRSGQVYNIVLGKTKATRPTLERWAPVLQMSADDLLAWYDLPPPAVAQPREVTSERVISPSKALEVFMGNAATLKPGVPFVPPDAISLTVSTTGRATLRLNLVDIPLKDALAIIELVKTDIEEANSL